MPPGPDLALAYQRVLRQDIPAACEGKADVAAGSARVVAAAGLGVPAPLVPRQLPAAPEPFVGREAELSELRQLLDAATGTVVISAIGGTAGIGKTALAVRWAHQAATSFPDGQLYVNLRGFDSAAPVPPEAALAWFLEALGAAGENMPSSLEARAALFRSLLAGRRMLVVLDNARDADQVRPLLPGSAGCLVLVTSRAQLPGLAASEGARLLLLGVLTETEARQMLTGRLGPTRAAAEPAAVDKLVALCARLPLALAIIAARAAARPGLPLADLAAELSESATRLDVLDGGDAPSSLRAVLSWSHQRLTPATARVFRLLGLHPGPDVTPSAAASLAGVTLPAAHQALAELAAASLITEHVRGRFAFHDLLRAYARDQALAADSDQARREAVARMLSHYLHSAHAASVLVQPQRGELTLEQARSGVTQEDINDRGAALAWFEAEHHVLAAALTVASQAGFDAFAWQLSWALSDFLFRRGHWHEWVACQRSALEAATRIGNRAGQASARRSIGYACARLGDYDQAADHLATSVRLYRDLEDRVGEARVHLTLGWVVERQGSLAEVLRHAQQAFALYQAAGDRYGEADALNSMGWGHLLLAHPGQARPLCRQALAMNSELGNRTGEAASWDSLGYAEHQLGRHYEAAGCYQRALAILRELGDRFSEAEILVHLGDAYLAAGELERARDPWEQALVIFDDLHQPDADALRAKLGAGPRS